MSGARITGTLINGLRGTDGTLGLETMCVGRRDGHGHDHRATVLNSRSPHHES
jgi:acetyl-CoA acetyltransferase